MVASLGFIVQLSTIILGFPITAQWSYHPSGIAVKFFFLLMYWSKYLTIRMFSIHLLKVYVLFMMNSFFYHTIVGKYFISAQQTKISRGIFLRWMGTIFLPVTKNARLISTLVFWSGEACFLHFVVFFCSF